MAPYGVQAVGTVRAVLKDISLRASEVKQTVTVEPPLSKADFTDLLQGLYDLQSLRISCDDKDIRSNQYAVIETAIRDIFNELLSSCSIDDPSFVQLWNLLDIVAILSDDEQCDAALLVWLVEELLDSQTIAGCRKVFDYLESRRERITAKNFKAKNLVILRSCNELLRRLSRAEDTAFCGRVFIFMFQSFPLGDKSSVNLRGEYHVENVTAFDDPSSTGEQSDEMDVDTQEKPKISGEGLSVSTPTDTPGATKTSEDPKSAKTVSFDAKKDTGAKQTLDSEALYPIFWSLQQSFSQPKRLFDQDHLAAFKKGLEATITTFKTVKVENARGPVRNSEESRRSNKRKRDTGDDDLSNTFNPKYLTSRDLFELEISDLSFRRHVLVQSLIIMDFLLSLSPKAKQKVISITPQNKSVMYQEQILSDEDITWAMAMKSSIADYLRQGHEGPFFYRMVETVLSRDKNWVRWKIENCPSIERPAVSPEKFTEARAAATKTTINKRLRPHPMGSLNLNFLAEGANGMEKLKDPSRYTLPTVESFKNAIAMDDLEIEMPTNEESKTVAQDGKASKSWRALRVASRTKLQSFDKIERSETIDIIFEDMQSLDTAKEEESEEPSDGEEVMYPLDRRSVIICGPSGVGRNTLVQMLIEKHPHVFRKVISHTTREPGEGEKDALDYHFIDEPTFTKMRDGDKFLEYVTVEGKQFGTGREAVEKILSRNKVPLMKMSVNSVNQTREASFDARSVYISPPNIEEHERRLRSRGSEDEDSIRSRLDAAVLEIEASKIESSLEKVIINDDLATAFNELESHVFSNDKDTKMEGAETTVNIQPAAEEKEALIKEKTKEIPIPREEMKTSRIEVVDLS